MFKLLTLFFLMLLGLKLGYPKNGVKLLDKNHGQETCFSGAVEAFTTGVNLVYVGD